jgi:hypothetical protein
MRRPRPASGCWRTRETPDAVRDRLDAVFATLDPLRLLRDIRAARQRLVEIADAAGASTELPSLETFLSALRTAGKRARCGRLRSRNPSRGRRRPDPLAGATEQLHAWFDEEPWRTSREILDKLQSEHPDRYPDSLLRTVQRRLKIWRSEHALNSCSRGLGPVRFPRTKEFPRHDFEIGRSGRLLRSAQLEAALRSLPPTQLRRKVTRGNIYMRQPQRRSGTSFGEATRQITQIVALHTGSA